MDTPARKPSVAAMVADIAARDPREGERLTRMLERSAWPGGHADRTEPAALEWVRRWGPGRLTGELLDCSCAAGRCLVCN
jgi:hypothetical protein